MCERDFISQLVRRPAFSSYLLLRDHGIIAQPCSLRQNVLRVEPPLTISESELNQFVSALDQVLAACPSPASALKMALRKRVLGGAL